MDHQVVCIGAMLVDELFYCKEPVVAGTSNPATVKRSAGGVMRNIAEHLALLGIPLQFITARGNDAEGEWLEQQCIEAGISVSASIIAGCQTGKYSALLNPDGSMYVAAAVNPIESLFTISHVEEKEQLLAKATIIIADTNLNSKVLQWLIDYSDRNEKLLFIDPVSVAKAEKLAVLKLKGLYMITPNEDELFSFLPGESSTQKIIRALLAKGIKFVWLRKGIDGSEMFSSQGNYSLPSASVNVKDITGAGDAALAAWIAAYCLGKTEKQCLQAAHVMAAAVIQVEGAIDRNMNQQRLFESIKKYFPDEQ